jgi:hypothetical protein
LEYPFPHKPLKAATISSKLKRTLLSKAVVNFDSSLKGIVPELPAIFRAKAAEETNNIAHMSTSTVPHRKIFPFSFILFASYINMKVFVLYLVNILTYSIEKRTKAYLSIKA